MRIAVCLAGQPRSWKICYKNLRKSFEVPGVEVDYFIHTWSENGSDYRGYPHEILDPKKLEEGLVRAYAPKSIQIESYTDLGLERWYSHRHSICSSLKLCQSWEEIHGFKYDWVFYSRLDFCRFRFINVSLLQKELLENRKKPYPILYGSDGIHWDLDMSYHMQDYAWFGSSESMTLFSCLEQDFYAMEALHKINPEIFREYCAEDFFPVFVINRLIRVQSPDPYWDCGVPVRQCLEKFDIKLETKAGLELYGQILDRFGWYYSYEQLCSFFHTKLKIL